MFSWLKKIFKSREDAHQVVLPIDNQNVLNNLREEGYTDIPCYAWVIKWLNDSNELGHYRFRFIEHSPEDIELTAFRVHATILSWEPKACARGTISEVYKSVVDQLYDY